MELWNDITYIANKIEDTAAGAVKGVEHAAEHVAHAASTVLSNEAHAAMKLGSTALHDVSAVGSAVLGTGKEVAKDYLKANEWVDHQALLFGEGVVTGAILNPVNAIDQIVNHVTGWKLPELALTNQAEVNDSWAGKIGIVGGTIVDFVATDGAVSGVLGLEAGGMASLAITGAVQGGILTPSKSGESGGHFVLDRLKAAAVDSVTFATMAGVAGAVAGAAGGGSAIAAEATESAVTQTTSVASRVLTQSASNAVGGGVSGIVQAEGNSLLNKGKLASSTDLAQEVVTSTAFGGAFGALSGLVHGGTEVDNAGAGTGSQAARDGGDGAPTDNFGKSLINRPAEDLERKMPSLKSDLNVRLWDTRSAQRRKLLANLEDGSNRIKIAVSDSGCSLYGGNTRLYYAKKLGIPDDQITVWSLKYGQTTLADLEKRMRPPGAEKPSGTNDQSPESPSAGSLETRDTLKLSDGTTVDPVTADVMRGLGLTPDSR